MPRILAVMAILTTAVGCHGQGKTMDPFIGQTTVPPPSTGMPPPAPYYQGAPPPGAPMQIQPAQQPPGMVPPSGLNYGPPGGASPLAPPAVTIGPPQSGWQTPEQRALSHSPVVPATHTIPTNGIPVNNGAQNESPLSVPHPATISRETAIGVPGDDQAMRIVPAAAPSPPANTQLVSNESPVTLAQASQPPRMLFQSPTPATQPTGAPIQLQPTPTIVSNQLQSNASSPPNYFVPAAPPTVPAYATAPQAAPQYVAPVQYAQPVQYVIGGSECECQPVYIMDNGAISATPMVAAPTVAAPVAMNQPTPVNGPQTIPYSGVVLASDPYSGPGIEINNLPPATPASRARFAQQVDHQEPVLATPQPAIQR